MKKLNLKNILSLSFLVCMFCFFSPLQADTKVYSFSNTVDSTTTVKITASATELEFSNNFLSLSKSISVDCYAQSKYANSEKDGYANFDKKTKTLSIVLNNFHECKISVPKSASINVDATNAKVDTKDNKYPININAKNTNLDLEHVRAPIQVNIDVGQLDIEDNTAAVKVKASSSKVKIDDARANIDIAISNTSDLKIDGDERVEYNYVFTNKPNLLQGAFPTSANPRAVTLKIDSDVSSSVRLDD